MELTLERLTADAEKYLQTAIPHFRFEGDERLRRLVLLAMAGFACEMMAAHLRDSLSERAA